MFNIKIFNECLSYLAINQFRTSSNSDDYFSRRKTALILFPLTGLQTGDGADCNNQKDPSLVCCDRVELSLGTGHTDSEMSLLCTEDGKANCGIGKY